MRSLFIDTASSRIILAILENDKIVYEKNVENDMNLSTRIFSLIYEMFQKTNIHPSDVDRIYVVNGPGSFTGVRLGVVVAKMISYSKNIPFLCMNFRSLHPVFCRKRHIQMPISIGHDAGLVEI